MKYNKEIVPTLEEKMKMANYEREESRKKLGDLEEVNKNNK